MNENIVRALIDSRSLKLTASSSRSVWRNATDLISVSLCTGTFNSFESSSHFFLAPPLHLRLYRQQPLLDIVAPSDLAKPTRSNLLRCVTFTLSACLFLSLNCSMRSLCVCVCCFPFFCVFFA